MVVGALPLLFFVLLQIDQSARLCLFVSLPQKAISFLCLFLGPTDLFERALFVKKKKENLVPSVA